MPFFYLADILKLNDVSSRNAPYVVLTGNCGVGKSTIVEKLTGIVGRSASAALSFTKASEFFWVPDKSLIIADTPGSNPLTDKLEHNLQIAQAFNYRKVISILTLFFLTFIAMFLDKRVQTTLILTFITQLNNFPYVIYETIN